MLQANAALAAGVFMSIAQAVPLNNWLFKQLFASEVRLLVVVWLLLVCARALTMRYMCISPLLSPHAPSGYVCLQQ
jgi:hypothetical protein